MNDKYRFIAAPKADAVRLRLVGARKERGLTQKQVSAECGIAQSLISDYENGKRQLGLCDLLALCELYGKEPSYIFGGKEVQHDERTALKRYLDVAEGLMSLAGKKAQKASQAYLNICIYTLVRALYKANPRHKTTRMFKLSDEQAFELIKNEGSAIAPVISGLLKADEQNARNIEPAPDDAEAFRELILNAEDISK